MNITTLPAACDMHVHLRDPGQTYKTDIAEGARIAARSGISDIAMMPNTIPVIDNVGIVERILLDLPRVNAVAPYTSVHIIAAVTVGQQGKKLTDFIALKKAGVIAVSDDGLPINDNALMQEAMLAAQVAGLPLVDHCEPEAAQVARDCELVAKTGAPIHIAHVSRAESLELIRQAKRDGLPVSCEVAPHHFTFTKNAIAQHGGNAMMNPPLAEQHDVDAVIEALRDGTVDVIASDHAPHHWVEKQRTPPPNGIIGLETLWSASLTALYFTGILTLKQLTDKLCHNPRQILKIDNPRPLSQKKMPPDAAGDFPTQGTTIQIDLDAEYIYQPKGRCINTPFAGMKLRGKVICKN